jgi:hypothetical protein
MKPRLIVHIGSPETGAGPIQRALVGARVQLQTACATWYASTERGGQLYKHASVTRAAASGDDKEAAAEYAALLADFERSGCTDLLLSDDELFVPTPSVPRFFAAFVPQFDIEVICYLRRADYFTEALYKSFSRLKKYKNIPPIRQFVRDREIRARLDYHRLLVAWRDIGAKVTALDFDEEIKGEGLVASFLNAAGLSEVGELSEKKVRMKSDMRLPLTLCLLGNSEVQKDHALLVRGMSMAAASLVQADVYGPLRYILGSAERENLLAQCAESDNALARDFGLKFADDMPSEGKRPILIPTADYLLALIGQMSLLDVRRLVRCCHNHDYAVADDLATS